MELLSPAGHWEAMTAAVQCGADAVYFGAGDYNARRNAKNFTMEELPEAAAYCRLRGVKTYLTVNTLLSDRELPQAVELLRQASRAGIDAVIVQDWGLAALARQVVPDLPLHGSTQMTIHSLAGAERAAELGLACAVLSRELSREDIRHICAHSPIPIEVFVHGALCMCWSGQCAMSALIGGRSGNRGACAQPCRLPYALDGGRMGRPLSLKDACLADHLQELEALGVSILKIEGRMKRPEYVAVVTQIYHDLLRQRRRPTQAEREALAAAFSREGFTDGYWQGRLGPQMFGSRPEKAPEPAELFRQARDLYTGRERRLVSVDLSFVMESGQPVRLTASDKAGHQVSVTGPLPEAARTRPLGPEELADRLRKTGGTAFSPAAVEVAAGEGLVLPAKEINALRREALERLAALRVAPPTRREGALPPPAGDACAAPEPALTVSLARPSQLTGALLDQSPAICFLPVERMPDWDLPDQGRYPHTEFCAALPRVCKDSEARSLVRLLEQAKEKGCTALAVQNIGQLGLAEKLGLVPRGDFGLNVFNSRSLEQLRTWGLQSACLSFELRQEQVRDLRKCLPCEAIVYGRLPLMVTENCLLSNGGVGCAARKGLPTPCGQVHALTDRRGERFPILPVFGCRSEIENSRRLFLLDKPEIRRCGLRYVRLRFTTEPPEACAAILAQYRAGDAAPPEDMTRGLFCRGVS